MSEAICLKCKGPAHPDFDCRKYVTITNGRGGFTVIPCGNEESARLLVERLRDKRGET